MAKPKRKSEFGHYTEAVARLLFETVIYVARCEADLESSIEGKPEVFSQCEWDFEQKTIKVKCKSWGSLIKFIDARDKSTLKDTDTYGARSSLRGRFTPAVRLLSNELGLAIFHNERDVIEKKLVPKIFSLIKLPAKSVGVDDCLKVFDKALSAYHRRQDKKENKKKTKDIIHSSIAGCNIPRTGTVKFVGRANDIKKVHELITSSSSRIVSITGMGGIGKTELGIQYAQGKRDFFDGGICWVNAKDNDPASQIVSFAHYYCEYEVQNIGSSLQQLNNLWGVWKKQKKKILFIFDDVTHLKEVKQVLPPNEEFFFTLITSRNQGFSGPIENYNLDLLSEENSLELLSNYLAKKRINRELSDAREIVAFLESLPLGLELIGHYLSKRHESLNQTLVRLQEKRDMWKAERPGVLEDRALLLDEDSLTTAQLGAKAAFDLTWEILSPGAQKIAKVISYFPSSFIDWPVVKETLDIYLHEYKDRDFSEKNQTISKEELIQFNLLKVNTEEADTEAYCQHPLLKDFYRTHISSQETEPTGFLEINKEDQVNLLFLRKQVIEKTIEKLPPIGRDTYIHVIEKYRRRLPLIEIAFDDPRSIKISHLLSLVWSLKLFYWRNGELSRIHKIVTQLISYVTDQCGAINEHIASLSGLLAEINSLQRNNRKAAELWESAIEIYKKLPGDYSQSIAGAYGALGLICEDNQLFDHAINFYLLAVELLEKENGKNNISITPWLFNLSDTYEKIGRYEDAKKLRLQIIEIKKESLGEDHHEVAKTLMNLGCLYYSKMNLDDLALNLFAEAKRILKINFGEIYYGLAVLYSHLGNINKKYGNFLATEYYYKKDVEINEKTIGKENLSAARSYYELGIFYFDQERYSEASKYLKQSLEVYLLLHKQNFRVNIINNKLALIDRELKPRKTYFYVRPISDDVHG